MKICFEYLVLFQFVAQFYLITNIKSECLDEVQGRKIK